MKLKALRNPQCDYFVNNQNQIDDKGLFKRFAIEIQNEADEVIEYKSESSERKAKSFIKSFNLKHEN